MLVDPASSQPTSQPSLVACVVVVSGRGVDWLVELISSGPLCILAEQCGHLNTSVNMKVRRTT